MSTLVISEIVRPFVNTLTADKGIFCVIRKPTAADSNQVI